MLASSGGGPVGGRVRGMRETLCVAMFRVELPKAEVAIANETKQQDFNLITNCMKIFAYVFRIKKKIRNYNKYEI